MPKFVIFNADDFGMTQGINRGIVQCHTEGVVKSTSLMVNRREAEDAAAISKDHPGLSVGLHWDVEYEEDKKFDITDEAAVRDDFKRQLDRFDALIDKPPTHIDSHHHAHLRGALPDLWRELVDPLGVPLRGQSEIRYDGRFYGQPTEDETDLTFVSVHQLEKWLEKLPEGWTEFGCHPGYVSPDWKSSYNWEREVEIRTLTDLEILQAIDRFGIIVASFADYEKPKPAPAAPAAPAEKKPAPKKKAKRKAKPKAKR
jgi:predicted glycoside hydrolase/deacetylase ChbG (UPF0249 family)